MSRRAILPLVAAAACAGAGPVRAQYVYFNHGYPDSVLAIMVGDTATMELWATSVTGGLSAYDITLFLDDARVRLVRADSMPGYGLPSPGVTTAAGQVTLAASGAGTSSTGPGLAKLHFEMDPAAVEGSFLSLAINSMTNVAGAGNLLPTHQTNVLEVCQALQKWGDLDASRKVNSRDALIAITAALGLPVGSFDVTAGDVDEDSVTTTRDALMMLSHGIGFATGTRIGKGRANRCAPAAAAPSDVAIWSSSTLLRVAAGDTVVAAVGTFPSRLNFPSWAPDGSRILITSFVSGYSYDFIRVSPDGLTVDTLRTATADDRAGAWSPDGTRIAFRRLSPSAVFVMDADGTNQMQLTDTITVDGDLAWSPDGATIAFTGYNAGACCTRKLWVVGANGTGLREVYPSSNLQAPVDPSWSPAGDSLLYDYGSRVYRVALVNDSVGVPATSLVHQQDDGHWVSAGIAFLAYNLSAFAPYNALVFRRASDGRHLRLIRGRGYSLNDWRFRSSSPYVDVVTVTPGGPVTLSLSTGPTSQQFAVSALDNLGGAVTPGSGFRWISTDPTVVSVDQTGLATAVATGSAMIVATAGGWRSDSASVTVNP